MGGAYRSVGGEVMPRKKKEPIPASANPTQISEMLSASLETVKTKRATRKKKTNDVLNDKKPKSVKKMTKKEQQISALATQTIMPDHYETVWTVEQLEECCAWLRAQSILALDTETMGVQAFIHEIVGISFYAPHKGYYIPLKHIMHSEEVPVDVTDEQGNFLRAAIIGVDYVKCLPKKLVADLLRPILEDRTKKLLLHNAC
jgi:DNA polymerase-1